MRFLFIGAPGVGKGTYASRIAAECGLLHVSSGDLLRAEVARGAPIGQQIKEKIDHGHFVPDTLISTMLSQHLKAETERLGSAMHGYILDGYPRNLAQAKFLDDTQSIAIDHVFNLRQPYNVIINKISSRRSCADCGFGYNFAKIDEGGIKMDPLVPKVEGVCCKCGSTKPLVTRPDDAYETVKRRLDVYVEQTAPLEDYYASKGILTHFDVLGGTKEYLPKLRAEMERVTLAQKNEAAMHMFTSFLPLPLM